MKVKAYLMDEAAMDRALTRIAHEIIERNKGLDNVVLVGIQRRGVALAKRLVQKLTTFEGVEIPMGVLDITFYRDDLSLLNEHPLINSTSLPFSITGQTIILVDDVLYTGRTCRALRSRRFDIGRPDKIQLAVMIDRGHRELPFRPDYVARNVPTSRSEQIAVNVVEIDGQDEVLLGE